jgi:ComF family protein
MSRFNKKSSTAQLKESPRSSFAGIWGGLPHELFSRTQDILFPAFCQLCDHPVVWPLKGGICQECLDSVPIVSNGCERCGAELPPFSPNPTSPRSEVETKTGLKTEPDESPDLDCTTQKKAKEKPKACFHCRQGKWPARRIYAFGTYRGSLAKVLVMLKRPGSESSAIALGNARPDWLLSNFSFEGMNPELVGGVAYDVVVSTPKYWTRRVTLRHNASELLAEAIGKRLGVPVWTDAVFQIRPTSKQGILSASQRHQNVEGAFAVNSSRSIRGKRVLVIDDIVTSGSTMAEICSILKRAEVESVDGFCAARGVGTGGK